MLVNESEITHEENGQEWLQQQISAQRIGYRSRLVNSSV